MAFSLPLNIISPIDANRLRRELINLQDFFVGAAKRKAGTTITPPKTTQLLEELAKTNKLSLLEAEGRTKLLEQIDKIIAEAPKLHISFAVDPPPKAVETILSWLRQNIDPHILIQIGLQPNIGAGCVLRTANREFDLSMRQHLQSSKPQLAGLIQEAVKHAGI